MRTYLVLTLALLTLNCGDGTLVIEDNSHPAAVVGTNNATTTAPGTTTDSPATNASPPANNVTTSPDVPDGTNNATVADTTGGTDGTTGMTTGMTTGPQYNLMFVAVADFMREKCVNCHNAGQNGNFIIPAADTPDSTVRMNLEGVVATTGRLLIEPNDIAASQVYIMITNSAGEQFPPETIALVADWINAGAPYDP